MKNNDELFNSIPQLKDTAAIVRFPDVDFLFANLPLNLLTYLRDEISKIESDFSNAETRNEKLAGHIKREFALEHCIPTISNFMVSHANWYLDQYDLWPTVLTSSRPLVLKDLWVNFQKKHEFNPPHSHGGVMSFVIWMQIPYDLKEETNHFPRGTATQTSRFGFITVNRMGAVQPVTIPIDKQYEGKVCFFPSTTVHYVNPFYTSDGYRISVSGNLFFNVEKN